jgi:hypothetical protein
MGKLDYRMPSIKREEMYKSSPLL